MRGSCRNSSAERLTLPPLRKKFRVAFIRRITKIRQGRAAMALIKFKLRHGMEPLNVEMWRQRARKRLPNLAWAYVDGGADALVTVRENMHGFRRWRLRQKVLTGVTKAKLETELTATTEA